MHPNMKVAMMTSVMNNSAVYFINIILYVYLFILNITRELIMLIELYYDYLEDSTKFMTMEDIDVTYGGKAFTIPKFTTSDGASIPRAFWSMCNPLDRPLYRMLP